MRWAGVAPVQLYLAHCVGHRSVHRGGGAFDTGDRSAGAKQECRTLQKTALSACFVEMRQPLSDQCTICHRGRCPGTVGSGAGSWARCCCQKQTYLLTRHLDQLVEGGGL